MPLKQSTNLRKITCHFATSQGRSRLPTPHQKDKLGSNGISQIVSLGHSDKGIANFVFTEVRNTSIQTTFPFFKRNYLFSFIVEYTVVLWLRVTEHRLVIFLARFVNGHRGFLLLPKKQSGPIGAFPCICICGSPTIGPFIFIVCSWLAVVPVGSKGCMSSMVMFNDFTCLCMYLFRFFYLRTNANLTSC
eukprot:Lithocolla_globosa_v1_NODE_3495_length_1656_cov_279.743285.p2 type:complete len:190 gc:universal NODE_3495_length_1656_cov_279.743285:409-978(+)